MKKIKQIVPILLFAMLMMGIACACSDDIDIKQDYEFKVIHLPVPKRLVYGETAEIRCRLVRNGNFKDTEYYFRYFQPDGKGRLRMDNGTIMAPNDSYKLVKDIFNLYYTSLSQDHQVIDVYFYDSFEKEFKLSFSFNNENEKEGK